MSHAEDQMLFAIRLSGLPEPEREFRFCSHRQYRFDFAWPSHRVALEVEGGIYTRQAHGSISGILRDIKKHNLATLLDWRVYRVTPDMVEAGTALDLIEEALR